jgi:ubiquitin carboxyl-terminal hydrolase L5
LDTEQSKIEGTIEQETEKQARWKTENERRRHNYVPLIFDLLTHLAKKNLLGDLFKDAVERKKEKDEKEKNEKEKKEDKK